MGEGANTDQPKRKKKVAPDRAANRQNMEGTFAAMIVKTPKGHGLGRRER